MSDIRPTSPSRRTVLRGAAHAMWVAPVVQLAATAPAFAANSGAGGAAVLSTLNYGLFPDGGRQFQRSGQMLTGYIRVRNTAAGSPFDDPAQFVAQGVQVSFANLVVQNAPTTGTFVSDAADWSFVGATATLAGVIASQGLSTLAFHIEDLSTLPSAPAGSASVDFVATTTTGTGDSGSLSASWIPF